MKVRFDLFKNLSLMFFSLLFISVVACTSNNDDIPENVESDSPITPVGKMKSVTVANRGNGPLGGINETVTVPVGTDLELSVFRADETVNGEFTISDVKHFFATWKASEGNFVEFVTPQFYLLQERKTALLAVHPQANAENNESVTGSFEYTIDGNTDIIATAWSEGQRTVSNGVISLTEPNLTFYHLLTMVKIKAFLGDNTPEDFFGKITSVKLNKMPSKANLSFPLFGTMQQPTWTSLGAPSGLNLVMPEDGVLVVGNSGEMTDVGYCMIFPIKDNDVIELTVETEKGTFNVSPISGKSFDPGTYNIISLVFTSTEIIFDNVSLAPWEEGQHVPEPLPIS